MGLGKLKVARQEDVVALEEYHLIREPVRRLGGWHGHGHGGDKGGNDGLETHLEA